MIEPQTIWCVKCGAWERPVGARRMRDHVMETLGSPSCRGWRQCQKWDPVTDLIKYLKLLIVQLESVPVLLGYSRSKEALWTRAVNFLLPRFASSRPETELCVHSIILRTSTTQIQIEVLFFNRVVVLTSGRHNRNWVINVWPDGS